MKSTDSYLSIVETVSQADSLSSLQTLTLRVLEPYGFDRHGFAASLRSANLESRPDIITFDNHSSAIHDSFDRLRNDEVARLDPRVRLCHAGLPANLWNVRGEYGYRHDHEIGDYGKHLLWTTAQSGTRSGITVPVHSRRLNWGFLSTSNCFTYNLVEIEQHVGSIIAIAHCIQTKLETLIGKSSPDSAITPREREVLTWAAVGKTSWEISRICSISERTVHFHLQNAASKLGVKGRRAACARAASLELISP